MRSIFFGLAAIGCVACSTSASQPPANPASPCPPPREHAQPTPPARSLKIDADYPASSRPLPGGLPLTGDIITCDFRVFANGRAEEGNPTINLSKETPVTMTFAGLRSPTPMMKGNGGESPIVVLDETLEDEVVIVERSGHGNIFTYTISRETGLAIWTKAYFMFKADQPTAVLSVGRCY